MFDYVNKLLNFITNKDINFDGPSLIVAGISLVVAVISIIFSVNGYNLSKKVFSIGSKRLANEGAETHVLKIIELISTAKSIKPLPEKSRKSNTNNPTNNHLITFENKNDLFFTKLNVSCSAFTLSRSLAEESYAYVNIGLMFCGFIRPHYEALKAMKEKSGKYADIIFLYNTWDIRHRVKKIAKEIRTIESKNRDISTEFIDLSFEIIRMMLKNLYKACFRKDKEAKESLKTLLKYLSRLQTARKKYNSQIKELKKAKKDYSENLKLFEKSVKSVRPLGL
jgi:hypothetical protein